MLLAGTSFGDGCEIVRYIPQGFSVQSSNTVLAFFQVNSFGWFGRCSLASRVTAYLVVGREAPERCRFPLVLKTGGRAWVAPRLVYRTGPLTMIMFTVHALDGCEDGLRRYKVRCAIYIYDELVAKWWEKGTLLFWSFPCRRARPARFS